MDHSRTIHQVAADLRRQQDRTTTPLPRRLATALTRAALLSSVKAHSIDTGKLHHLKADPTDSRLPAGIFFDKNDELATHLDINRWSNYLAAIIHHVELFERALDDEQGLGEARHHATLSGDELDKQILEQWQGVPSHVVATKAPWLGSPRTIENVRARHGLSRTKGEPRDEKKAA